jgi:hypothetical protein
MKNKHFHILGYKGIPSPSASSYSWLDMLTSRVRQNISGGSRIARDLLELFCHRDESDSELTRWWGRWVTLGGREKRGRRQVGLWG